MLFIPFCQWYFYHAWKIYIHFFFVFFFFILQKLLNYFTLINSLFAISVELLLKIIQFFNKKWRWFYVNYKLSRAKIVLSCQLSFALGGLRADVKIVTSYLWQSVVHGSWQSTEQNRSHGEEKKQNKQKKNTQTESN